VGTSRQFKAGRDGRFVLLVALAGIPAFSPGLKAGPRPTQAPKPGSYWDREIKACLKKVKTSTAITCRWMVDTPTLVLHSTLSKEYTAAAMVHLQRFDKLFLSIFKGKYKDASKQIAYAFATEEEYLSFSPEAKGSQGRFLWEPKGKTVVKNLAWFSTPPGENDFYKTDFGVVQHEATHQLLYAYTGNPHVPKWFDEGCATFFESWDLEKSNKENLLSGLAGDYARGISLSFPREESPPPLASHWISHDNLLLLDHLPKPPGFIVLPPGGKTDLAAEFASEMRSRQEYNEAWCALTFFINNDQGQKIFNLLVKSFRDGDDLAKIQKKYYSDEFLTTFRTEWHKFIKDQILPKWELPTVGGGTFPRGLTAPPPEGTHGFRLTKDKRSDMFLVEAEKKTIALEGREQLVWMLRAWSIPVRFYDEAWEQVGPLVSRKGVGLVGGLYMPTLFHDPASGFKAVFLEPAFSSLSKEDRKNLASQLTDAAIGLIFRRDKD
jgi:hypothetical protein